MLRSARGLYSRMRTHIGSEKGISTIEWIGLTAVVLVFLSAIFVYVQVHGGQVGTAAGSSMDGQIALWESGGSRVDAYSDESSATEMHVLPGGLRGRLDGVLQDLRAELELERAKKAERAAAEEYQNLSNNEKVSLALAELRSLGGGKARLADDLQAAIDNNEVTVVFDQPEAGSGTRGAAIHLSTLYGKSSAASVLAHEGFHALEYLDSGRSKGSIEEEVYAFYLGYQVATEGTVADRIVGEDLGDALERADYGNLMDSTRSQDALTIISRRYEEELQQGSYQESFSDDEGETERLRGLFEIYRSRGVDYSS